MLPGGGSDVPVNGGDMAAGPFQSQALDKQLRLSGNCRAPRSASARSSPIARASGTDRASRSSWGATRVSPSRTAARPGPGRTLAAGAGQPVVEIGAFFRDAKLASRSRWAVRSWASVEQRA